jgi:beta-lactamase superfamily II metal-dependent hydrolase
LGFEVDFMPVGDYEKGGDAITMRWGDLNAERSEQFVAVIDGGTKDSGEELVQHIKKYYNTDLVNLVVSSHPDADHSSGLTVVLEELKVKELWMHCPWNHAQDIKEFFEDNRITNRSLKKTLIESLQNAYKLESIAKQKQIPVFEPFSDFAKAEHPIVILGPNREFYDSLLPNFRETPEPREAMTLPTRAVKVVKETINWIAETWGKETLTDPQVGETSGENNTSVILLFQIDGKKFLFTGDAGIEALNNAIDKANNLKIDLMNTGFLQIPHHGSKHNIGPTILNKIIGEKLPKAEVLRTAFVSAPKKGEPKHPSRKVVNAFIRRGAKVFATQGNKISHFNDAPDRGWIKAEPLPFHDKVAE